MRDIMTMENNDWRVRLAQKIEESGKSMRAISIAIGRAAGYVFSIMKEGKTPNAETLAKICAEIGTSVSYVLYGLDLTPEDEEFIILFSKASPAERAVILALLRSKNDAK